VSEDESSNVNNGVRGSSRRTFLKQSALSSVALGSAVRGAAAEQQAAPKVSATRPNIVLICADQLRPDFIGAYGENPTTKTPNIDGMVRRGVAFKQAVTNDPLCSPSRGCMITGRYALETGEWKLTQELRKDLPTLAGVLRENGYTANFIGKWHLAKWNMSTGEGFGHVLPPIPTRELSGIGMVIPSSSIINTVSTLSPTVLSNFFDSPKKSHFCFTSPNWSPIPRMI
jgi:hypothetical protein